MPMLRSSLSTALLAALAVTSLGCEREPPVVPPPASRQDARIIDAGVVTDAGRADAGPGEDVLEPGEDAAGPGEDARTEPPDGGPGGDASAADGGPAGDASAADGGPGGDASAADGGPSTDAGPLPTNPCAATAATDPARYAAVLACLADATATDAARRAAIERFLREVEASEGFPIRDGNDLVYVYVRTAAADAEDDGTPGEDFDPARRQLPITVAGDFNGWDAAANPLQDAGHDFFHARIAAPAAGTTRSGYKLVARDGQGATVYFSDPLSRRFDYDGFGRISFSRGGTDHGHLERFRTVHATQLNDDRTVYVWLPPGYETSAARYPVLYMHDGNNLFDPAQPNSAPAGSWQVDEVVEAELQAGRIRAPIVIGVPNDADRFDEYTQVPDDFGGSRVGGRASAYARFLVDDLKPRVDARFRTLTDRADTGLLGSSLGGLVSYYVGAQHPSVFRFVGGMSSTFAWGSATPGTRTLIGDYAAATDLALRDQVFYLDSGGGAAQCTSATDGADNYCATAAMRDALVAGGVSTFPDDPNATPLTPAGVNIYHWHEPGAAHTESAWRARLFRPLRLFLRP